MGEEVISKNFIEQEIDKDLAEGVYSGVVTRFPPEPNGYLHIGHAKSIILKSSGYKTHASLDVFCDKYSDRIKNRYLIYTKDLAWEKGILYLPVYMTMFL